MKSNSAVLLAAFGLLCFDAIAANKTDVVTFVNGDRLTGEVKSLERGRLRFKTEATDTISIEWDNVAALTSTQNLQVETEDGVRYLGRLSAPQAANRLVVLETAGPVELDLGRIVLLAPIEERGIDRIDGDISAGFNFTKAEQVKTTHISADLNYRTEARILSLEFDSMVSDTAEEGVRPSQDHGLSLAYNRLLEDRWVVGGIVNLERNDELGLDLRTSIGAGGGRYLRQTNNSILLLSGGLLVSREQRTESVGLAPQEEDTVIQDFLEASVKLQWDWFRYDTPELDLTTTLELIPNITESGEYRGEFEIKLKWEIVEDLFWSLSLSDKYDSKVGPAEGEKNDYSIITSIGWDF
jgi:hypothetical protein